jgi:Tfp pilus assembly protein PilO
MAALNVNTVHRIRWELARLTRRQGPLPIIAVVIVIAAIIIAGWGVWLHRQSTDALTKMRTEATAPVVSNVDTFESASMRLAALRLQLPERNEIPTLTQKLYRLADKHQVRLAQGNYRSSTDATAKLMRYQIGLPVKGEAARIQAFVIEALNDMRPLSLEGLSFKREKGQSASADAQIQFVLVTRI